MSNIKHVGRITTTGRKCIVAYRTIPGDAYNCLIIPTETLTDSYHDALINLVESSSGQSSYEFAESLARATFPDGSTMLPSLHAKGKLIKVPTGAVEMTPSTSVTILLSELNQIIAEQRGVTVDGLAIKPDTLDKQPMPTPVPAPVAPPVVKLVAPEEQFGPEMTTEDKLKYFRSEADRLSKEAAAFRKLAAELAPAKTPDVPKPAGPVSKGPKKGVVADSIAE